MRTLKPFGILGLLIIMCLSNCSFNSQYINREEDKKDAERITTQLYDFLKDQNYKETLEFFSDKFFEVTDQEQLIKIYTKTREKLGDLKEIKIEQWETRRIEGTNPSASYMLIYVNQYEKYEAKETIQLIREDDSEIKIVAYNINSMGFME